MGNLAYPSREIIQYFVDNHYFALVVIATNGSRSICACSVFLPLPTPAQLTQRSFQVAYQPVALSDSLVGSNDTRVETNNEENFSSQHGLPPEIYIPLNQKNIEVRLI